MGTHTGLAYDVPLLQSGIGSHGGETVKVFNLKDLTTKDTKSTKF